MRAVIFALLIVPVAPAFAWNPQRAADWLDARQKAWFEWPNTKATGGPCISCHTGMPYLMARPMLRKLAGQTTPTIWETGLIGGMRARITSLDAKDFYPAFAKEPAATEARGVESIFAMFFLSGSPDLEKVRGRLWPQQRTEGPSKGAWAWFNLTLDPYEMPESNFLGATLVRAALLRERSRQDMRQDIELREHDLNEYLDRELKSQPLHNKLFYIAMIAKKQAVVDEALAKQNADGGWSLESLGPWAQHATAPPHPEGSDNYATAWVAWALSSAGLTSADPALLRAAVWLAAHQTADGSWPAVSMNKTYPPGSMQEKFMTDAATAFAALALAQLDIR